MSYESSTASQVPAQKQFGCSEIFSHRFRSSSGRMIQNHESQ